MNIDEKQAKKQLNCDFVCFKIPLKHPQNGLFEGVWGYLTYTFLGVFGGGGYPPK